MNIGSIIQLVSAALLVYSNPAGAAEQKSSPESFKPFSLVGEWIFVNSESGRKYSGDINLQIKELNTAGKMRGTVSFDGRQTNDNCSTKGVFNDDPVEAEIIKTSTGYDVSFTLNCSKGKSPRLRKWNLSCENGICTQPEVLPHGKGGITLKTGA